MQPVFRFAPSPNGYLHLGHAASALLNSDLARRAGGQLLLRIEDIDPVRSLPAYEAALHEDLAWLGLTFDGSVRRQSEHLGTYSAALDGLERRGLTYRCFCSRAGTARRVADAEATGTAWPRDPDGAPHHAGSCRDLAPDLAAARAAAEPHAVRLAMDRALADRTAADWVVPDWDPVTGMVTPTRVDPSAWGDVILGRRDVRTSYHLSVVIDDALQGVSHVVRGADLAAATAVHCVLQRLLDLPSPLYHHHPLVLDDDGAKLSKSRASPALRDLRAAGMTPAAIRARLGFG